MPSPFGEERFRPVERFGLNILRFFEWGMIAKRPNSGAPIQAYVNDLVHDRTIEQLPVALPLSLAHAPEAVLVAAAQLFWALGLQLVFVLAISDTNFPTALTLLLAGNLAGQVAVRGIGFGLFR